METAILEENVRTRTLTLADILVPPAEKTDLLREALLVLGGALLVSLLAQWEARLPFSPVPVTGQTLGVLLAGAALGGRRAFQAMLLYLGAGVAGLPLFSGGAAGPAWLLGPTGGYLAAFPLAAWTAGRLAERGWDRSPWKALAAMAAGNLALYLPGLAWLSLYVGPAQAPALGLTPFLVGDLAKIVLAAALLPGAWRLLGKESRR